MTSAIEIRTELKRSDFALEADVQFPAEGITAIFGPSGAGKTTLLRQIAGLEHGTGRISIAGEIWQGEKQFLPPHERAVGYVFQEASLFEHLSVRGNLEYGLRRSAGAGSLSFDGIVSLLSLASLLDKQPAELSGGEQKRVAIGRALLRNPQLMLLDEPTASLDVQHRGELLPFLENLRTETQIPMLYVSHSPEEVARLADHLILMDGGKVVAAGPLNELLTDIALPIAHASDAAAVIEARPTSYDEQYGLTTLTFAGGQLQVLGQIPIADRSVRVRIFSRDVSIAREAPRASSILNILPARVLDIDADRAGQVLVQLEMAGTRLLSRITRKSADTLGLKPGDSIYAQIKTAALV